MRTLCALLFALALAACAQMGQSGSPDMAASPAPADSAAPPDDAQ
jgi:hypothetical protein